jgi:monoamine oxidase
MKTDVVIVGGGLSGLALAEMLHCAGVDFQVLEARAQFGGRISSTRVGAADFDLGPAWFWPGQPRIASLIARFGLKAFEQAFEGAAVVEDRAGHVRRAGAGASMQGALRIDGGMTGLVSGLLAALPTTCVHSGRRVSAIKQEGGALHITAQGSDEAIIARRAVLALPPRIAQVRIAFSPPLPDPAMAAMAGIPTWMAGQAKFVAVYDTPFWRHAGLSGDAMSQFGPMVELHDASAAGGKGFALFGFVGVPAEVRQAHADELRPLAIAQLERLFGPAAASPQKLLFQDWAQEVDIATLADHLPAAGHPAYGRARNLSGLWQGRLRLGSTEMASEFGGFLEGALEAAEDVFGRLMSD